MTVPHLPPAAVRQRVQRLSRHGRTFVAIFGSGERDSVPLDSKGTVEVIPVRSELELREQLPPLGQSPYRAYLVPFAGVLPEDIAGRFIEGGRIDRLGPMDQLASLLGAAQATAEAALEPLASYLLRVDNPTQAYGFTGQVLDVDDLYRAWLSVDWRLPAGELALDTFLGWAALDGRGGSFAEEMAQQAAGGVEDGLRRHLGSKLGALGPLILSAWRRGAGARLLGFALLAEVLLDGDAGVKFWLRQKLKEVATPPADADLDDLTRKVCQVVRPALSWIKRRDESVMARVLDAAEKLIDDPDIRPLLIASHRLPTAWKLRLEKLNSELEKVAAAPDRGALQRAEDAWRSLEHHEFFALKEHTSLVQPAEMALRLAAWLVTRPDRAVPVADHSYGAVEALASWYAEEGGFLDWARRSVRSLQTGPLASGAGAVVLAVDTERVLMDRRFAEGLSAWIHAGRPSKNVLPIDRVLERVAARFLEQSEDRRLLVLLMDGMAWAQAVELLPSLGEAGLRWGPIAWMENPQHRIGFGRYPAMLAALPTMTEVSRAAFFAGKLMKNGAALGTDKDVEHFGSNKHMQRFVESHLQPKLMLRGDGHTADGSLTAEAQNMIAAGTEQRVVGIVVNAIDASLKGDSQQDQRWTLQSIRSLPQLFQAAEAAGRHVLLVADHGHVPADRLKSLGKAVGGGARYRRWMGPGDELAAGERKFSGEGVYLPKGDEGVVLLEDDGSRYGGAAHAGEHGGASLAEVVAPCILLGYDDPIATQQDKDLQVRSVYTPDWWTRSLAEEPQRELDRSEPAPKKKQRTAKVPENQTSLFAPTQVDASSASSPPTPSGSAKRPSERPSAVPGKAEDLLPVFFACEMLKARASALELRRTVVQAVHYLLARPGGAPEDAFASHLGTPVFRVGGLVSKLQEVLNLDGYEVLRYDRSHQQIFLDKTKLEQQFEVKL